ncbi:cation:proton antiporter [Streptomyces genisteinicus]|uniref:Cation:proton antiporter n=1 Tax=Streptomyces genisteinicus TaxID=2768068 RepID=A0A7H0HUM2_9ACTN|nr:cation:proton antiporter [Streptomyces genisteinicus]QNP64238.1 cation:proton antiporter [Streptomyces genisteinicus]
MSTHGPAVIAAEGGSTAGIVLADLALVLVTAYLFAALAKRVRQPAVMGEIVAGVALGPSLLGLLPGDLPRLLFPPEVRPYLETLAQLGLVLFMFGVGYQLSLSHVRGVGSHIAVVSFASVALPFAMGAGLALLLYPWLDKSQLATGNALAPALFLGAAMSITAFPVLARIIAERGLQKHRVGTVALVSAAIQDVIAWSVLAAVVTTVTVADPWSFGRTVGGATLFVLALVFVVRPALTWLLAPERRWSGSGATVHVVLCAGLLTSAWITDELGLHAVFGAFLFGTVVPRHHIDAIAPEAPERIDQTSLLLLPVFFTVTGLSVDLGGLGVQGLVMVLAIVAVACAGKFLGAAGAARLTGASPRESTVLGILLNARGLTELVVLNVGLSLGALDDRLFTAMVVMALVTTLMTGPLLTRFRIGSEPAVPTARRTKAPAGEGAVR